MVLLREFCAGGTRFNELHRGVPRMSPTLLAKRLKELEAAGVIERTARGDGAAAEYRLTPAGEDLKPIVMAVGFWGQRWVETQASLDNLDPGLLMWDMRRNVDPEPLSPGRCTVQFEYSDLPSTKRHYWLVVEEGAVDLCYADPGFDVDLYVVCPLRAMTAIWMGLSTMDKEVAAGRLELIGPAALCASLRRSLRLSPFAGEKKRVA